MPRERIVMMKHDRAFLSKRRSEVDLISSPGRGAAIRVAGRWITLLIICLGQPKLAAEDWPRFLGPRGDGTSLETGLADQWPAGGAPVVWKELIGTGYSAPSISGDNLVLHHRVGNEEQIRLYSIKTQKVVWETGYPTRYVDPYGYNNGPRCSPTISSDGKIYTFGAEGVLSCVQLEDGKVVWRRETQKDWNVPEAFFGVGSTPLLDGNRLYVMVGGQPNSGMVALDSQTGETVWESVGSTNWDGQEAVDWPGSPIQEWKEYEKQASYASPVLAELNGEKQLLCFMRQGLVALDPSNGKVLWDRWFRANVNESVNAINPVVHDGQIFISSAYYRTGSVVLDPTPDHTGFEEIWKGLSLEIHWSAPLLIDGYLYAFTGRNEPDGILRCVKWSTGEVKWESDGIPAGMSIPGRRDFQAIQLFRQSRLGRGSGIYADGKLYLLGERGSLVLAKPNSEKFEEISRMNTGLKFPCWTAPVLSSGRLYLRSEETLLSLDVSLLKEN